MAIIPSHMSKNDILDMLIDLQGGKKNSEGFGYGYVKEGKFVYNKTHLSLEEILKHKNKKNFFGNCFNHNSWVLFHLRAASRGGVCAVNSHPHEVGNWLICHNGTAKSAPLIRACFGRSVKYKGQTDTEICGHLLAKIGPRGFNNVIEDAGVFLALEKNGSLWAFKTDWHADLKIARIEKDNKDKTFLISELDYNGDIVNEEMDCGYLHLSADGKYIKHKERKIQSNSSCNDYWNGSKFVKNKKAFSNNSDFKKPPIIYRNEEIHYSSVGHKSVYPTMGVNGFDYSGGYY